MFRNEKKIALALYEANDTPVSLGCYLQLKYQTDESLRDLVTRSVDPDSYTNAGDYFRDATSVAFLKKFPMDVGIDRVSVAKTAFFESEKACFRSNLRLGRIVDYLKYNFGDPGVCQEVVEFILRARTWIRGVLGRLPHNLLDQPSFGPGNVFESRRVTSVLHKIDSTPTCSREFSSTVPLVWDDAWRRSLESRRLPILNEIRGNRFTTVPKDATKDRGICIEPSLNIYFQKAVGARIGDRLRRAGLDIGTGQERHRELLLSGYSRLSTIDLSSASDTVCKALVELLLPEEWFDVLDMLRSHFTYVDGRWHKQEKFSSMGNGFTFELETLLFSGLVYAVLPESQRLAGFDFSVYGDDILVPNEAFEDAKAALRFFGFQPNPKKSFGPQSLFRESCGFDLFDGRPVRPFYLKRELNEPNDFFSVCNGFDRMVQGHSDCDPCSSRYRTPWLRALENVPTRLRYFGPRALGDLVIATDSCSPFRVKHSIRYFKVLKPMTKSVSVKHTSPDGQYAAALYGADFSNGFISVRGAPRGYRTQLAAYS